MSRFRDRKRREPTLLSSGEDALASDDVSMMRSARAVFAAFCALAIVLVALGAVLAGVGLDAANAAEFDSGNDYAEGFIGDTGWKSDVITDLKDGKESVVKDPGKDGKWFISSLSDFFLNLGVIIIAVTILLTVARFAGRGLAGILLSNKVNTKSTDTGGIYYSEGFWRFFMTAQERKTQQMGDEWFFQMCKESVMFFCIGLGAGVLVMVLTGIGSFIAGQLASTSSSAGIGDFNVSGIHVTTK